MLRHVTVAVKNISRGLLLWRMDLANNWTPECQVEEVRQRETCDVILYTITCEMIGVYSIAEVVDDSNKRPDKTIFCLLEDGFDARQLKSLEAVGEMVERNGGQFVKSLKEAAEITNGHDTTTS